MEYLNLQIIQEGKGIHKSIRGYTYSGEWKMVGKRE